MERLCGRKGGWESVKQQRERERETDRQTDRQTEGHRNREKGGRVDN